MVKITKIIKFWLSKATIVTMGLILALNMNIPQVQAASLWDDIFPTALANSVYSSSDSPIIALTGGDAIMSSTVLPNTITVTITAYSSTPDQTKPDDPFTMASGKHVYNGAVAANFLPLGTKIKIPAIFGDKIFTVEDRMAKRFSDRVDIWYPNRSGAKRFGIQETEIEIL